MPSPAAEVLAQALAVDPGHRFQTAAEFANVLAPHIGGAKEEMALLHQRLAELEASLAELEGQTKARKAPGHPRAPRKKAS